MSLPDTFFRTLSEAETEQFREYARTHDPDLTKWGLYHPVSRAEWVRLGKMPLAEIVLAEIEKIRVMVGYREDGTHLWLGPSLHRLEDAARAALLA